MILKYNLSMRIMHWLSGIGFLFTLFLGIIVTQTSWIEKSNELQYILLHKSFGLLVFFLAVLRIIIRCSSEIPNSISNNTIEKLIEKITHYFLYFAILMIPISGYMMSSFGGRKSGFFNLFNMPIFVEKNEQLSSIAYNAHKFLAITALCFIGLHILGTMKHIFIDKNNILKRII
jgi:cytochrome b561